jgi:GWxTD domain-containing protein
MKAVTLFFLLFTALTFASDVFYVDYSSFKTLEKSLTRTDIYVSIPVANLEFDKDLESVFSIKIFISDKGRVIAEDKWKQKYQIAKAEHKYSGAEIPVVSKTALPPGYYGLKVEVEDLNAGKIIDILEVPQESKKFRVADFPDGMSISTIQLASRIITEDTDENSEFYRQGMVIIPNPSKIFGTTRPFIFYYTELYGINKDDDIEYSWRINSAEGGEALKGTAVSKKSQGNSMVIADRILVPRLKTGSYDIYLRISNKTTGKTIEGVNNFYIFRKIDFASDRKIFPDEMSVSARDSVEIEIMKDGDIALEFDQVMATLDNREQSRYSGLLPSGKREYLKNFWSSKEIVQKNARENFKSLLRVVQNEFSTKNTEGWKTDRGRIYLKMGPPSKKDIETFSSDLQDHEIWYYFEGNYTFVFADTHGLGDFKLVHSDHPGERNDPNWKNKIKRSRF